MRVLAVVPARGGSKGLPRKNALLVGDLPLLVHTLRAARRAELLDHVVVSTDDDRLARIAEDESVEVVRRPAELAADDSPTEDALIHAVEMLGDPRPDYVVTLEPTSPLRTARLIDECVRRALDEDADSVLTVAETTDVLGRLDGSRFRPLDPSQPRRRQLREPLYRETSTVYVTRTAHLLAHRSVLADDRHAVVVPPEEAIDVNDALDLALADLLLRRRDGA